MKIEEQAFQGCTKLSELMIPSNVEIISYGLIFDTNLDFVNFQPNSKVTVFPYRVFAYTKLEKIFIPKSVTSIENDAFIYSSHLTTVIFEEKSNLKTIGSNVFPLCNLYNFSFPSGISTIGNNIFRQNMNLTKIFIPNSLTTIDINAFGGCPNIYKIEIEPTNTNLKLTGTATLTDFQMTKYYYISKDIESLNIAQTITQIPKLFIQICDNLTVLTVDGNNNQFSTDGKILYNKNKDTALSCCGGLKSVSVDQNCKYIGTYCFSALQKLESLTFLGNNLKEIWSNAFANTAKLKNLKLPASLVKLDYNSFFESSVEYLTFEPNSQLNYIGDNCFMYSNLTSASFGNQLSYTGNQAFLYCHKLTQLSFDINCPMEGLKFASMMNTSLIEITVPINVQTIEERVFAFTKSLKKVIFPKYSQITSLGPRAFSETGIEELTLPNSLTQIMASCFSECDSLRSIKFEEVCSITSLASGIFKNCNSLPSVNLPKSITRFDSSVFQGCSNLMNIFFDSKNENYKSVDGVVYTKDSDELVAYPGGRVSARIDGWVKSIGSNAFYNCSKLKSVIFNNDNIEVIPASTFEECNVIERVFFPRSLKHIRSRAFYQCTHLYDFCFPDSLLSVNSFAFFNCSNFIKLTIPPKMNLIGSSSFAYCENMQIIDFKCKSIRIDNNAFMSCNSLSRFNIRDFMYFDSEFSGINSCSITVYYYGAYDIESSFINNLTRSVYVNCSYFNKTFCHHHVIRDCVTEPFDANNHLAFFQIFICPCI